MAMNAPAQSHNPTDPIAVYLARLGAAAYGLDSALVHDMLADAEEHLRSATREGIDAAQAVADFGAPDDVVAAYVTADRRQRSLRGSRSAPNKSASPFSEVAGGAAGGAVGGVAGGGAGGVGGAGGAGGAGYSANQASPTPNLRSRRPLPAPYTLPEPAPAPRSRLVRLPLIGVWFDRYAWGSLVLFILGLIPAVIYFTLMAGGVALSVGLIPSLIGIPMLLLVLGLARLLSLWHGMTIETFTGVRMPRRFAPIPATGAESLWGRLKVWLTDGRSWLSAFFLIGNLPVAVLLFSLFLTILVLSLSFTVIPLADLLSSGNVWTLFGDNGPVVIVGPYEYTQAIDGSGYHRPPLWLQLSMLGGGALLMTLMLYLARGTGWLYAQAAKAIQVSRPNPVPV
jgi:hypothetical protein